MGWYDPAIAANIIAAVAALIAFWSIKVAWRTEQRLEDQWLPEIASSASRVETNPDWVLVSVSISNNARGTLYVDRVSMIWPLWVRAVPDRIAEISDKYGTPILADDIELKPSNRSFDTPRELSGAGTNSQYQGRLDRSTIRFYVKGSSVWPARRLRFSVSFSRNRSDTRRFMRRVSMQRIIVPARQTD